MSPDEDEETDDSQSESDEHREEQSNLFNFALDRWTRCLCPRTEPVGPLIKWSDIPVTFGASDLVGMRKKNERSKERERNDQNERLKSKEERPKMWCWAASPLCSRVNRMEANGEERERERERERLRHSSARPAGHMWSRWVGSLAVHRYNRSHLTQKIKQFWLFALPGERICLLMGAGWCSSKVPASSTLHPALSSPSLFSSATIGRPGVSITNGWHSLFYRSKETSQHSPFHHFPREKKHWCSYCD